jgi:ribosome-binding protein aMBF1 (putative translation factor)
MGKLNSECKYMGLIIFWVIFSITFILILLYKLGSRKQDREKNGIENLIEYFDDRVAKRLPIPKKDIYDFDDLSDIGMNIEYARKDKGLTQKQLAELIGYKSASFISRLERSETTSMTHEQLEKIPKALGVEDEYLRLMY